MKKPKLLYVALAFVMVVSTGVLSFAATGLRINKTASVPLGLYRRVKGPVERGRLVELCLPEQLGKRALQKRYLPRRTWRACPGGASTILKVVAAVDGDQVVVRAKGLEVNGEISFSWGTYHSDPERPLELPVHYRLAADEVWLHGLHPLSWDSRHFGPVRPASGVHVMEPFWVAGSDREER